MTFKSYILLALVVSMLFGAAVGYPIVQDGGNNGEFFDEDGNFSFTESWHVMAFFAMIPFAGFMIYGLMKFFIERVCCK